MMDRHHVEHYHEQGEDFCTSLCMTKTTNERGNIMNITEITSLLEMLSALDTTTTTTTSPSTAVERRKVLVRGDRSGVFFGTITARDGQEVTLEDVRHIWFWAGAANTAEMSVSGVSRPDECKFVVPAPKILVLDAIEVLDCTAEAIESLESVPVWSES